MKQLNLIELTPSTCQKMALAVSEVIEETGISSFRNIIELLAIGIDLPKSEIYNLGTIIELQRSGYSKASLTSMIEVVSSLHSYLNENPKSENFDILFDLYYYVDYYLNREIA